MTMFVGWPPCPDGSALSMNEIGYAARVFSVNRSSSRSSSRLASSIDDVLEHGAESAGRRVDLRLRFGRQADRLGVAAAFEVEHAAVAPPVLVVADQPAVGIARERRLAGAGQPEEQRDVAGGADVRRAVHRQHAAQRQQVVEDGEDRLLDLAGVARAADQHQPLREVERDHDLRAPSRAAQGSARKPRRVDDRELGPRGASAAAADDEQVAREEAVPRVLGDDANRQAVLRVRARRQQSWTNSSVPLSEREQVVPKRAEVRLGHRPVDAAPRDVPLRRRVADDELVVRRPAGVLPGPADERAVRRRSGLPRGERLPRKARARRGSSGRSRPLRPSASNDRARSNAGAHRVTDRRRQESVEVKQMKGPMR